jgi:hypothetical protein
MLPQKKGRTHDRTLYDHEVNKTLLNRNRPNVAILAVYVMRFTDQQGPIFSTAGHHSSGFLPGSPETARIHPQV